MLPAFLLAAAISWLNPQDPKFTVNGLPWLAENKGELIRLPRRLEAELPQLESRRQELERQLADPGAADHRQLEALSQELAELLERISAAEERWLALSELTT